MGRGGNGAERCDVPGSMETLIKWLDRRQRRSCDDERRGASVEERLARQHARGELSGAEFAAAVVGRP